MNKQKFNLENEDEIILQLQNEIRRNNELIEEEKIKLEKTTKILKIIYIIIGLWSLCFVSLCVTNNISNNISNNGCIE